MVPVPLLAGLVFFGVGWVKIWLPTSRYGAPNLAIAPVLAAITGASITIWRPRLSEKLLDNSTTFCASSCSASKPDRINCAAPTRPWLLSAKEGGTGDGTVG